MTSWRKTSLSVQGWSAPVRQLVHPSTPFGDVCTPFPNSICDASASTFFSRFTPKKVGYHAPPQKKTFRLPDHITSIYTWHPPPGIQILRLYQLQLRLPDASAFPHQRLRIARRYVTTDANGGVDLRGPSPNRIGPMWWKPRSLLRATRSSCPSATML